jgi:hypothetical protein
MSYIKITKEKIVAEDLALSTSTVQQSRGVGTGISAAVIPFTEGTNVLAVVNAKETIANSDAKLATKAALNGSSTQTFSVDTDTLPSHAVNRARVDELLLLKASKTYVDSELATKAELAGSSLQQFEVADDTNSMHAVNRQRLDADLAFKANTSDVLDALALKADVLNVLRLDGLSPEFTPTSDNQPATKKYIDDKILETGAADMRKAVYDTDESGIVDTTEGVGIPGTFLGLTPQNKIMRLSQSNVLDCNTLSDFGIFVGTDVANAPTSGFIALEQMSSGIIKGQRCLSFSTLDWYYRTYNGTVWSAWSKTLDESEIVDNLNGGTLYKVLSANQGKVLDDKITALNSSKLDATDAAVSADKLTTARTINGVSFDGSADITVSDSTAVKNTGNETISGVKTFTSSPIVPTPTTDFQVATKKYVDEAININTLPDKPTSVDTDNFVLQEVGGDLKKLSFENLKLSLFNPTLAGTVSFDSTTNNIELTNIVTALGLEIGDVIQISGAEDSKNNSEFTVEVITDDDNIIVNQAHANKGTSKNIATRASDTGVTVKLLAKWYNALIGLGMGWVDVTSSRNPNVNYNPFPNRDILVGTNASVSSTGESARIFQGGYIISSSFLGSTAAITTFTALVKYDNGVYFWAPSGGTMTLARVMELR